MSKVQKYVLIFLLISAGILFSSINIYDYSLYYCQHIEKPIKGPVLLKYIIKDHQRFSDDIADDDYFYALDDNLSYSYDEVSDQSILLIDQTIYTYGSNGLLIDVQNQEDNFDSEETDSLTPEMEQAGNHYRNSFIQQEIKKIKAPYVNLQWLYNFSQLAKSS
ncbi:hypothetical protein [Vaginisenegalia massiliensis]|uniref:hypothetical protein n=1 Tax=Vaginisenegalia massiliensis TaxID=2058294 RepID=UPI000F526703|nr:hypothetical protein [Vaginisenegalia massiliensis]